MSVNKVILLGHTGGDVKMHHFDNGNCIGNVSLATNETYKNKSTGEKVSETQWHNLVFRNKTAEIVEKYVKKGDQIFVEGSIKNRKWQDSSGQDKQTTEIHVFNFSFVGSKNNDNQQGSSNGSGYDDNPDDLPF